MPVCDVPGLRPTPDRVRETLFNWLQDVIEGACCLDLFAGTGALGLEAASRGASSVVLLETHPVLVDHISETIFQFDADEVHLERNDALDWLQSCRQKFDVVFLDPPFHQGLVEQCCERLSKNSCLQKNAVVYIEAEHSLQLPAGFRIIKQGSTRQVKFLLVELV